MALRFREATDVMTQRLEAMSLVQKGTVTWAEAQYGELIAPEDRHPLISEATFSVIQKEAAAMAKMRGSTGLGRSWQNASESSAGQTPPPTNKGQESDNKKGKKGGKAPKGGQPQNKGGKGPKKW